MITVPDYPGSLYWCQPSMKCLLSTKHVHKFSLLSQNLTTSTLHKENTAPLQLQWSCRQCQSQMRAAWHKWPPQQDLCQPTVKFSVTSRDHSLSMPSKPLSSEIWMDVRCHLYLFVRFTIAHTIPQLVSLILQREPPQVEHPPIFPWQHPRRRPWWSWTLGGMAYLVKLGKPS